jgi:hypothetical protein
MILLTCVCGGAWWWWTQLLFLVSGILSAKIVDSFIMEQVYSQARLDDPSSDVFKMWADPTSYGNPIYMQIAVWDLQNEAEFLKGANPDLKLVGPFTFTERRLKHSFHYTDDKSVVWYKENSTFHLVDTVCPAGTDPLNFTLKCTISPDIKIHSINIPLLTTISLLEYVRSTSLTSPRCPPHVPSPVCAPFGLR